MTVLLLALTGCATLGDRPPGTATGPALSPATPAEQANDELISYPVQPTAATPAAPPAASNPLWERLRQNFTLAQVEHPRIDREVHWFTHNTWAFDALLTRAEPFLFDIAERVERRGMPAELALLPAVESGFLPMARSPEGAAGLWQFMPATGRSLGLRQDWWYDGRRDLVAGTEAALTYLDKLQRRFDGDWLHALAAYNAGGATVARAIRKARAKGQPTDFWNLDLPRETSRYVPRLLALVRVVRDPARHGVALPQLPNRPYFAAVDSGGPIDLHVAAELAQIEIKDLLLLNPGFKRWATHPEGPHRLLLPRDRQQDFRVALATLPNDQRLRWKHYVIKPGDNLSTIARRNQVSIKSIKHANKLGSDRIRAGRSLVIPLSDAVASLYEPPSGDNRTRLRYRVRRGDSLYKIARKFQVKIGDLRRWNDLGRYLQPGQRLTVYVDG